MRSLNGLACVLVLLSLPVCHPASASDTPYNAGVDSWRKKDYAAAASHWSQAVLGGDIDAMNNLAFLYFHGLGMKPRIADAIRLWRVAAFAGESESQWHLGAAYEDGKGIEKDAVKAYAWYRCAVVSAQRKKGSDERGIEADIEKDAAQSMAQLVTGMTAGDLSRASALADQYIRRYGAATPL